MSFTMHDNNDGVEEFGDDCEYDVSEGGVLTVRTSQTHITYAPGAWSRVEGPPPVRRAGLIA